MRSLTLSLFGVLICTLFSNVSFACTSSTQYPNSTITTDSSSLASVTISTCNYAGEYAVVVLQGSFAYTFESSVATDYLEITSTSNVTINTGTGSVTVNNTGIDTVHMHIFTNSSCSTQNTCRTTTVTRAPCLATTMFPTYVDTASSGYDTHFVSNCNYAGQYYEIVLFAGQYEIASSDTNDIFVFTDTSNNLYFSQQSPVIANVTTTTFLVIRVHIFTNVYCATESACRTTTVRRLPCIATSQYPTTNVQASYDPALDTITDCNYAGEYIQMDIDSGETYEVTSDSSDWFFLTLTDDTYLASGQTPFSFTNPYGDTTVRVHIFRDSNCGELSACRQTYLECLTCPVPEPEVSASDSVACLADLPVTLTNNEPFGQTYWYTGSCGSTPIDSGTTIQVSPTSTTTYYCANWYQGSLSTCDSKTLQVFPSPSVAIGSVVNVLCYGETSGSAMATGSAGQGPYAYLWSTGSDSTHVSNLSVGELSVLLTDDNGCHAYDTVDITQPDAIQDSIFSSAHPLCAEDATGSLGILINGGTAPFDYQWSNAASSSTISGLIGGQYTLTLTDDNGCVEVFEYTINAPDTLMSQLSNTDVWCKGDSNGASVATITGGTSGYNYLWSTGDTTSNINDVPEGIYMITVTDANGCEVTDTASISYQNKNPIIMMDSSDIICVNKTLTLDAGSGFVYNWSTNESTQSITINSAGTYTVTVTDFNGCSSSHSIIVEADSCLGVPSIYASTAIFIYPNPSSGSFEFRLKESTAALEVRITSVTGELVSNPRYLNSMKNVPQTLELGHLAPGLYLAEFRYNNAVKTRAIVIER